MWRDGEVDYPQYNILANSFPTNKPGRKYILAKTKIKTFVLLEKTAIVGENK